MAKHHSTRIDQGSRAAPRVMPRFSCGGCGSKRVTFSFPRHGVPTSKRFQDHYREVSRSHVSSVCSRATPAETIERRGVFCGGAHVRTVPWDAICVRVACCVGQSNLTAGTFVPFALPWEQSSHRSLPRSILPPSHRCLYRPARWMLPRERVASLCPDHAESPMPGLPGNVEVWKPGNAPAGRSCRSSRSTTSTDTLRRDSHPTNATGRP